MIWPFFSCWVICCGVIVCFSLLGIFCRIGWFGLGWVPRFGGFVLLCCCSLGRGFCFC